MVRQIPKSDQRTNRPHISLSHRIRPNILIRLVTPTVGYSITAVERILKITGVVVLRIIFHCVGVCRVTSFERKLVEVSLSGGRNCCIWLAHLAHSGRLLTPATSRTTGQPFPTLFSLLDDSFRELVTFAVSVDKGTCLDIVLWRKVGSRCRVNYPNLHPNLVMADRSTQCPPLAPIIASTWGSRGQRAVRACARCRRQKLKVRLCVGRLGQQKHI